VGRTLLGAFSTPPTLAEHLIAGYKPHPIWFAINHNAIIETGTPNNHATPYFIAYSFSPSPGHKFVIYLCNMHSTAMRYHPCYGRQRRS
jgi:hypothetical protein